jgi:hypothetical protein
VRQLPQRPEPLGRSVDWRTAKARQTHADVASARSLKRLRCFQHFHAPSPSSRLDQLHLNFKRFPSSRGGFPESCRLLTTLWQPL